MFQVKEIYKLNYMRNEFSYVGTIMNGKKFDINDDVFFVYHRNKIFKGKVVGIELPPIENPEYKYKIKLPKEAIQDQLDYPEDFDDIDLSTVTLDCDHIFLTPKEAKESAIKNLHRMFDLQMDEIDRYFKQFESRVTL